MADISKIKLPSGTTYDIKDAVARATLGGAIIIRGTTTTAIGDESSTNPITIGGQSYTAVANDAVFYNKKEYIFDGTMWHEFGDMSGLGSLATKNSASGTFTPQGTVSAPVFTGTQGSVSVTGTPLGNITIDEGTANYTPAGTVSEPTITVTPSTTTKYVATSSTGGGSVHVGEAASCTLPTLSTSVQDETLTLSWSAGSFTANTPTTVTLPTFSSQTIATGISSATSSQPTFTGTGVRIGFHGSSTTSTGNFTPQGTNSAPTFTGTQGTVTVS